MVAAMYKARPTVSRLERRCVPAWLQLGSPAARAGAACAGRRGEQTSKGLCGPGTWTTVVELLGGLGARRALQEGETIVPESNGVRICSEASCECPP